MAVAGLEYATSAPACYIPAVEIDYYAQYFSFERNDWWFVARRRIVLELIGSHLPQSGEKLHLLDAGCGTGITLEHLQSFGTVRGVDNELVALNFCRSVCPLCALLTRPRMP